MKDAALIEDVSPWLEVLMRVGAAGALSVFVVRAFHYYSQSHQLFLLLLLIAEILTVCLVITARFSRQIEMRLSGTILTGIATFYFLAVSLDGGTQLLPYHVGQSVQMIGIGVQIAGKMWLGRSFGLLPANRGVVTTGPYRLVRHPIYLGYFLNHMAFLLQSFSMWNAALYTLLYAVQIARISKEERMLMKDPVYRDYMQRTRWRFIPFIF